MTQNQRLVEYFVSNHYRTLKAELAHVVSPTFEFTDPSNDVGNFDRFIEYTKGFPNDKRFVVDDINTADDMMFIVKFSIEYICNSNKVYDSVIEIIMKDNLIDKVRVYKSDNI